MYAQPIYPPSRQERRRAVRIAYRTRLRFTSRRQTGVGRVRDISFDGLFLETPRPLAVGDHIDMSFRFRHTRSKVPIAGEVRHIRPQGVGVRLTW
jgi:hypothetical protein